MGTGPTIITPLDFRGQTPAETTRRPPWRRRVMTLVVLCLVALLAAAGWFVLTAQQVTITITPDPDTMRVEGSWRLELAGRFLMRPGPYEVSATAAGHHPLAETIEVVRGGDGQFHFELQPRPGIVSIACVGADAPDTLIAGAQTRVGDRPPAPAPITEIELDGGEHAVEVRHDRYQTLLTTIAVEGFDRRQSFTLTLRPDWAPVEIATTPVNASVWLDGVEVATTPCRIDVDSGERTLELRAEGFEPWRRTLAIAAEEPVTLADITLAPVRGTLRITTTPPGGQVVVDGDYAGLAPVEVEVRPEADLLVRVARDGYEPAERTARVGARQVTDVAFALTPRLGVIRFDVEPADAVLFVDGVRQGLVPPEITLTAEAHRLRLEAPGFTPFIRDIRPRVGVPQRIQATLTRLVVTGEETADPLAASTGYRFASIEGGTYTMGASRRERGRRANESLRTIELRRPFAMGVREVTNAEFRVFRKEHESESGDAVPLGGADRPVVRVTWDDAARFCNWLSVKDELPPVYVERGDRMHAADPIPTGYRLPTEAEWEYCIRSGPEPRRPYPWGAGSTPPAPIANLADESAAQVLGLTITGYDDGYAGTAPVASFPPNALGLRDLAGNVAEWCHDYYSIPASDPDRTVVDPTGPPRGAHHVIRGSSWRHSMISPLRSSFRDYSAQKRDDVGFRLARYLTEPTP
ncbi:MAG: SUMF1/EgtB/PvdO family nonheme iron enzyme [Phycisphaerales bacterium]|nr:SUMF1/EgtB/PvdO family nonheme iron enzyme [Phycisphaerales bacterium]